MGHAANRVGGRAGGERTAVRLRIASLASGGEGVAHTEVDGERRAVFVPRTAPGDLVDAQVDFAKSPARGVLSAVIDAAGCRIEPVCAHAARCGGCDWMHLSREAQIGAHVEIVRGACQRTGVSLPPIQSHACATNERYRTRARLAVEADGSRVRLGFRAKASHGIESIATCVVLVSELAAALVEFPELLEGEVGKGELALAFGRDGRPVADLSWSRAPSGRTWSRLEACQATGAWAGVAVRVAAAKPVIFGDPRVVTAGGDGRPLTTVSAGFAQANPAMSQRLTARALALVPPDGCHVLELFSGAGNFSVALAAAAAKSLTTVESDAGAVACARSNLASRGLERAVRVVRADADGVRVPEATEVVWLDPPRSGARAAVASIARSTVRRVAYVSCHPATLARDLRVLVDAGFRPTAVETFEMFPHTSHVEVLVALERASESSPRARRPSGAMP